MGPEQRGVVFWCGSPPSDAEKLEFGNRGLFLRVVSEGQAMDFAAGKGLVCSAKPPHLPYVRRQLSQIGDALDHGLLIYLLAEDDTTHTYLESNLPAEIRGDAFKHRIRRRTAISPHECAEMMARHSAGRALNPALEIAGPVDLNLDQSQEFLLKRAFSDCKSIALKSLTGGRSASVFEVRATLQFSEVGPRPMPFFAKLDDASDILQEQQCYESYASQHIPYHLRPNLDYTRCIAGVQKGILVGNFVDRSESLWDAVQAGKGPRSIDALFEDTLFGWRRQAYRNPTHRGRVVGALPKVFRFENVVADHVTKAAEFGPVKAPRELWEDLLGLEELDLRFAPMHGDMHGLNVRVRDNDAIIIDLAKTCSGPLCADLASLDVWLSFEPPSEVPDRSAWLDLVKNLYSPTGLSRPPINEPGDSGMDWLHGSIRKIRMHSAAICEPVEYQTAIALYLLRRACYPARGNHVEDAFRRAAAYWVGSNLVGSLVSPVRAAA